MTEKLTGTLACFYDRDEATGESHFGIETDEIDVVRNRDGFVFCDGVVPKWPADVSLLMTGQWDGNTYRVKTAKPVSETEEASRKVLKKVIDCLKKEDSTFKISVKGMNEILRVSGPDIFGFVKSPDALESWKKSLPKIKEETLSKIYNRLLEICSSNGILDMVIKYGGTVANCSKLIRLYGPDAIRTLRRSPYKTGYMSGMDFYTCDRIAFSLGMDPISQGRLEAIIYEALEQAMYQNGSTYVTQSVLKKSIQRINRKSAYADEEIPDAVIAAAIRSMRGIVVELVTNSARIYKKSMYNSEQTIASNLKRLNVREKSERYKEEYVEDAEKQLGISYSEEQKEAFRVLETSGVKIITGGPGTGKTTVLNGILWVYRNLYPEKEILLCAPTGRAAQRMAGVTGMKASTIHMAVEHYPFENRMMVRRNAYNPLDGDMIVVDEMSMADTEIFSLLLPAIKSGSTVILVGDENQLPSVSPGNVLHDLIESGEFEMHRLKEVYRQKSGNAIIENAYRILNGSMDFVKDSTFELNRCDSAEEARAELDRTVEEMYPRENAEGTESAGRKPDIQILSPVKAGECGTIKINRDVAEKRYGGTEEKKTFRYGRTTYHAGEKVIFGRNNYDKNYSNGDIGEITSIGDDGFTVTVNGEPIEVDGTALRDVSLAYAVTIHKSQGGESDTIVIVLPDTCQNMLNRNLLFTAVTRAKKKVKIIYVNSALYDSVHTSRAAARNTGLCEKINGVRRRVLFAEKHERPSARMLGAEG